MKSTLINKDQIIDQLRILKPELEERYGVIKIGIFGSLARNESHDRSDIDIVVEMLPDLLKRANLKEYLETLFNKTSSEQVCVYCKIEEERRRQKPCHRKKPEE